MKITRFNLHACRRTLASANVMMFSFKLDLLLVIAKSLRVLCFLLNNYSLFYRCTGININREVLFLFGKQE